MSTSAVSRTRSTDKRFYGVVQGIVTDVNDDKGKEGRVKVQFPWFDDQMETEWCRVRQFYAGNDYGSFFIPEVGDEVLVAFIHGDMRLPVILGGLYNGKDKPPSHRTSDLDQKMIRTKGKHELLFDDTPGKKRVRIKTEAGHTADLSDVDKRVSIQSSGGQTVVVDDSANTITLETKGTKITVDGSSGAVTVKATTTITLDGQSIKLGGSAAMQSLVLGDLFMTMFNTHVHNCTGLGAPSGPPIPPNNMLPIHLSQVSKTS
jgi:phage baseplate assembly protein V